MILLYVEIGLCYPLFWEEMEVLYSNQLCMTNIGMIVYQPDTRKCVLLAKYRIG